MSAFLFLIPVPSFCILFPFIQQPLTPNEIHHPIFGGQLFISLQCIGLLNSTTTVFPSMSIVNQIPEPAFVLIKDWLSYIVQCTFAILAHQTALGRISSLPVITVFRYDFYIPICFVGAC